MADRLIDGKSINNIQQNYMPYIFHYGIFQNSGSQRKKIADFGSGFPCLHKYANWCRYPNWLESAFEMRKNRIIPDATERQLFLSINHISDI